MYHMKRTKIEEYNKLPGTPWRQDSWINVCCLLHQQWRRHHRNHHVRLEMESCGNIGLVYSPHCQEVFSRSTFRRHQLLWVERKRKHTTSSGSRDFDDDSANRDLAYSHTCMVSMGCPFFFVIFSLLYMLAQIVVFRQTMADDPKTFNIFSRNDYATKSGVLFQKNDDLIWQNSGRSSPLYMMSLPIWLTSANSFLMRPVFFESSDGGRPKPRNKVKITWLPVRVFKQNLAR